MSDQNPFTASKLPFAMLVSVALSFVLALVLMFILELSGTIAMFAGLMILIVVFALLIYFLDEPAVTVVAAEPEVIPVVAEAPVVVDEVVAEPVVEVASTAPEGDEKPLGLDAPRDGTADDLKLIKGVGPKLEALLNSMGFWHFDQVAAWTTAEISWVDENLEGFKGRVTRDEWVAQARILAEGDKH